MVEPVLDDYIRISWQLDKQAFCEKIGVPLLIAATLDEQPTFQDEPTSNAFRMDPETLAMTETDSALIPQMPVIEIRSLSDSIEIVVGRDEENDIVEGFYHKEDKILGVQWHPERKFKTAESYLKSENLITSFIENRGTLDERYHISSGTGNTT